MNSKFLAIYDEYYDSIYRYIRGRTGSQWDADDIVSEIFRKAFEAYRPAIWNPKAWLFAIARNTLTDHYRKNQQEMVPLEEAFCGEEDAPIEGLVKKEELNCLRRALSRLEEDEMDLIALRYFSNLKYEEIQQILCKKSGVLRVNAGRIVKKLKSMVTTCMEGYYE